MKRPGRNVGETARRVTRRGLLLGGMQAVVIGILIARMRRLQVAEADRYRLLAEENRINMRLIPPTRGLIFDRNGVILAENMQTYRIVIVREEAGDVAAVLGRLQQLLGFDDETLDRARTEVARRSPFVPVTVLERVSWEEVSRVSVNAPALPGVTAEVALTRNYPLATDLTHVVGYVGPVSDYDLKRLSDPDPVLQIPRFQIGKFGVEARLEDQLRGRAGTRRIEVNAAGRLIRELERDAGTPGADLQLTIDVTLQNFVQARLGGESAAAVVMDVQTGDLLASGSAPSFDPNAFVRGISGPDYRALLENDHRPLSSKSVQGQYPPGSTFKMVVALAALEAGVISPTETVYCPGYYQQSGRRFHCWKRGGHGHMNVLDSMAESCDVYYYEVAQRVGIERIAAMARRLGLGVAHDLPLSGVAEGLTPDPAWKVARRGANWLIGDTLNAGIGQGFVLSSPLQLAVMTARIAAGTDVAPRLVKSIRGVETPPVAGPLGLSTEILTLVRRGMFNVSNTRRGTAWRARIDDTDLRLAGKTGTSQVRNITVEERRRGVFRNEDLPWNRRDHALFVGFAPFTAPRYAVSVVVEHGGSGSATAAPVARDILLFALHGGLPPIEAYPPEQRAEMARYLDSLDLRPARPDQPQRGRA